MSVSSRHPEYTKNSSKWELVRDVLNSDVKKHIKDVDINDKKRNERYKDDARFTNFTARTKNGLVGAVFITDPVIQLPNELDYLRHDATGSKFKLKKLAQECVGEVLQSGRFFLMVDYPNVESESLTRADVEERNLKARIFRYKAESVINWHSGEHNNEFKLDMVVIKEPVAKLGDDGFSWVSEHQYRVLKLVEGVYTVSIYNKEEEKIDEYVPRKASGGTWNEIPALFIGSEDNDSLVDPSPLYDLAELNLGHLRNSADYEESVHIVGQPTFVISSEMSAEQFKAANPNGVKIGARKGFNLGAGGSAQFLQANPNQLADEAMKRKEEQAVMIGARLIQSISINETAEAARIKHSGENSVLRNVADNVEDGIKSCLKWCAEFMMSNEVSEDNLEFEMNKKFFDEKTDPQLIMAQIQLYTAGIIAAQDLRKTLRDTGAIDSERTDEDIDNDILQTNPLGGPDLNE